MNILTVKNQTDYDAIKDQKTLTKISINSEANERIYISKVPENCFIETCGSSQPTIETCGSSQPTIKTCGSSQPTIKTCGSSQPTIETWDSSQPTIKTWDSSQPTIETWGSSQPTIKTWDSSQPTIETCGSSQPTIETWDSSQPTIKTWGSSQPTIKTWDSSQPTIETCGSSQPTIETWDSSQPTIKTWGSSQPTIKTWDSSQPTIETWDSSQPTIETWGSSQPTLDTWMQSTAVIRSNNGNLKATQHQDSLIRYISNQKRIFASVEEWLNYWELKPVDGKVTLYKAVRPDGRDFQTGTVDYAVGATVECPDWKEKYTEECGHGLHCSPHLFLTEKYAQTLHVHRAVEVDITDIRVPKTPMEMPDKVRVKKVQNIRAVDEKGKEVKA